MRLDVSVCVLAGLLLAGCGAHEATVSAGKVGQLVLLEAALPHYSSFYLGKQTSSDTTNGLRADPGRSGRQAGWIARYHRPGTPKTRGPLVIESRADVFRASAGAKSDLKNYRTYFDQIPGSNRRELHLPRIGAEAVGITFVQPGPLRVRFYKIAWRYRNVDASITVNGFDGRVTLSDAVALARTQERAIEAA